jgi:inosine-uridine nucleoside N-ribohydrolase
MTSARTKKVIVDTDIGWMNDDCTATLFALMSDRLDVIGITPVMGNFDLEYEVACALRLLELTGFENVPVCPGFDRPSVHRRDRYADSVWGQWATFQGVESIPPGMPSLKRDARHAVDFIVESVCSNPHEVTLLALGPLTNIAAVIDTAPQIASLVREIIILGGAISCLPDGHGNATPTAEFNFWVDPEAAKRVLESDIPKKLIPINTCRKTYLDTEIVDRIANSPMVSRRVADLFQEYIRPLFDDTDYESKHGYLHHGMYDHTAVAYAIDPTIFESTKLSVEIVIAPGSCYGMSIGFISGDYRGNSDLSYPIHGWPEVSVIHDMDYGRLIDLYVSSMTRPVEQ